MRLNEASLDLTVIAYIICLTIIEQEEATIMFVHIIFWNFGTRPGHAAVSISASKEELLDLPNITLMNHGVGVAQFLPAMGISIQEAWKLFPKSFIPQNPEAMERETSAWENTTIQWLNFPYARETIQTLATRLGTTVKVYEFEQEEDGPKGPPRFMFAVEP